MKRLIVVISVAICLSGCTGDVMSIDKEQAETIIEKVEALESTTEEAEIVKESTTKATAEIKEEVTYPETVEPKEINEQQWKQAYIKHITEEWERTAGMPMAEIDYFNLILMNEDDIPELYCHYATSGGGTLNYYNGEELKSVNLSGWGTDPLYIEQGNQFYTFGGRMDTYDNVIYSIQDNRIIESHRGEYGFVGGEDIPRNKDGEPYYRYFWDGVEAASEEEYKKKISTAFDESKAQSVLNNAYSPYEIIEAINRF